MKSSLLSVRDGSFGGMISDLVVGDADLIAASMTVTPELAAVVDFLHPLGKGTYAIFVATEGQEVGQTTHLQLSKHSPLQQYEWLAFSYLFASKVWLAIAVNSVAIFAVLKALEIHNASTGNKISRSPKGYIISTSLRDMWMILASNFGAVPRGRLLHVQSRPVHATLLIMGLGGTIVFLCYRASLTAELAVQRQKLPFSKLNEFLDSDYKLVNANLACSVLGNYIACAGSSLGSA